MDVVFLWSAGLFAAGTAALFPRFLSRPGSQELLRVRLWGLVSGLCLAAGNMLALLALLLR